MALQMRINEKLIVPFAEFKFIIQNLNANLIVFNTELNTENVFKKFVIESIMFLDSLSQVIIRNH